VNTQACKISGLRIYLFGGVPRDPCFGYGFTKQILTNWPGRALHKFVAERLMNIIQACESQACEILVRKSPGL